MGLSSLCLCDGEPESKRKNDCCSIDNHDHDSSMTQRFRFRLDPDQPNGLKMRDVVAERVFCSGAINQPSELANTDREDL